MLAHSFVRYSDVCRLVLRDSYLNLQCLLVLVLIFLLLLLAEN